MPENIRPDYYHVRCKVTAHQKLTAEETADIECIDLINALGLDFHQGNALKYLWRAWKKPHTLQGDIGGKYALEDLRKARTYIDLAIAKAEQTNG